MHEQKQYVAKVTFADWAVHGPCVT